jgi:hypothetical protein
VLFAHRASKLMLDTSPVRRFAEAERLYDLATFLGDKAFAPPPVIQELKDISGRFTQIRELLEKKWPKPAPQVAPRVMEDIFRLQKRFRPSQRQNDKKVNLGEIAAVQMAIHLGFQLLVADDELAASLSRGKLPRISTAMVTAEMVALEQLADDPGWIVWDSATPVGLSRTDYERAVALARRDIELGIYT